LHLFGTGVPQIVLGTHPPTARRFVAVDEVNRYRIHDGRIAESWALEDNLDRLAQLGLLDAPDLRS